MDGAGSRDGLQGGGLEGERKKILVFGYSRVM